MLYIHQETKRFFSARNILFLIGYSAENCHLIRFKPATLTSFQFPTFLESNNFELVNFTFSNEFFTETKQVMDRLSRYRVSDIIKVNEI